MSTLRVLSQPFLDTIQAAAYIGRSRSTLYRLAKSGKIPYTRPNRGKLCFRRFDLDAYMASNPSTPAERSAI
ncbi:MAG: helix-turn-helix domain-containing protein [Chlorobiaceae bacterium]|nr:helix-turn-helix domain-containing protein [Chlorobiaceae bacterium]